MDLFRFREEHTPQCVGHRRGRVWPRNVAWLVFIGWVISYVSEQEGNGNPTPVWPIFHGLENPMDKEPGRLQSMGSQIVGQD